MPHVKYAGVIALATVCAPPAMPAQRITIATQPSVTIGAGGDENSALHAVAGAWKMSNGQMVIVDQGGPAPIRSFTKEGKFDRVIARSGAGPGEVGPTLFAATRSGDSIVTFEIAGARASVFDVARGKASTATIIVRNAPSRPVVQGILPNNRWFVTGAPAPLRNHDDGAFRDTTYFGSAPVGGDSLIVFGQTPRMALYANNKVPGPPTMMRVRYDSLVPWTTIAVHAGRIVVADPTGPGISIYNPDGTVALSIPHPFPAAPYNAAEVARAKARSLALAKTPGESGIRAAMFDLSGRPRTAPRFKRLIPGADGELWVEKFWLDETAPREYVVLDRAGKVAGRVTGAPPVRFTEFGRDYALGIARDANDVQTVVMYKLTRQP